MARPPPEKAAYVGGEQRLVSDHEQAHIVLGFEGRAYNSDGFYAVQILASILGGGMSSRLFQEVREKRGLCYSVYAFHWAFADSGIFGVAASTGEEEVTDLVPVVLDELRKATETITDEEVIRVRNQIRAGLLMSLESPSSRAGQLARQQILWGRPIPLQETVDRINRITADRVKDVAGRCSIRARSSLAGIGPVANLPDYRDIAATAEELTGRRHPMMLTWFARDETPVLIGAAGHAARAARRRLSRLARPAPAEPRFPQAVRAALDRGRPRPRGCSRLALKRGREEARAGTDYTFFIFVREGGASNWSAASRSPTSAAAPPSSSISATGWASPMPARA